MQAHNPITLGSLFDGIGGFPYAASFYGVHSLWASEIVPECVSITKRHFPDMAHMGDVTELHGAKLAPVDIITFGSPCQGLSISGRRLGLADKRSGLFMEAIRIIYEMRKATNDQYPRFALFENVPGALSSAGGFDFKTVLEAFTQTEIPMPGSGRWADAGMVRSRSVDLAWIVYDAQYFGTAQRRRRLFLVADFRGKCAGEILFVPKSLRGYFEAGGTPRQGLAAFAETGSGTAGPASEILTMGSGQANAGILYNRMSTLTATHEHPLLVHPKIAGTLCASGAGLSRPAGIRSEPDFCIVSAGFRHKAGSKAGSVGYQEETAPTLLAGQQSAVFSADCSQLIVRRLTPTEAERLQGCPDNWTKYGADGKTISDTKRYSMLGNGIAAPCAAYIMQGIRQAIERSD